MSRQRENRRQLQGGANAGASWRASRGLDYLWRAVDQDGDLIDVLVQKRRNAHAAKRFFRRLLTSGKEQDHSDW